MQDMGRRHDPQDAFADVQRLLASGHCKHALKWLVDSRTGRIKKRYRNDLPRAWYLVGSGYYRLGRLKRSMLAFRRALKHGPDNVNALTALAHCYEELRKPKMAERLLRRALEVAGARDDLLYNLGNALFDQGRYFEAATTYKRVSGRAADTFRRARRNYEMALERSIRS